MNVKEVLVENSKVDELIIDLDTNITPDLKLEGITRTLIRNLNNCRKKKKLSPSNRINLYISSNNEQVLKALDKYDNKIKKSIQADNIINSITEKMEIQKFKIDNDTVEVSLEIKN